MGRSALAMMRSGGVKRAATAQLPLNQNEQDQDYEQERDADQ